MLNVNTEVRDGSEFHTQIRLRVDEEGMLVNVTLYRLGIYNDSRQFMGKPEEYSSDQFETLLLPASKTLCEYTLDQIEGALLSEAAKAQ